MFKYKALDIIIEYHFNNKNEYIINNINKSKINWT
jgi:hypothetical protein